MRKNILFFLITFLAAVSLLSAQNTPAAADAVRWYRSNSSGIALELIPSRLAALRNEYCLSIERADPYLIPEIIIPHYDNTFTAELRILYENREESRRQWIFRDNSGLVRLVASGSSGFFYPGKPAAEISSEDSLEISDEDSGEETEKETEKAKSGFIEIRNSEGYIARELLYDEDLSEWEFLYLYEDSSLASAETWHRESPGQTRLNESENNAASKVEADENEIMDAEQDEGETIAEENEGEIQENPATAEKENAPFVLICTDYYRYSRPGSLRAIERVLSAEAGEKVRLPFPRLGPGTSQPGEIITPRITFVPEFLSGAYTNIGERASFTIDSRGRILTEVWRDEDGEVLGVIMNTWDGDRLGSVLWRSGDQTLLVEYEYDNDGDRIAERNFAQGVLERSVTSRNGREIEEIYIEGKLMLRAIWEKGIKISEERITTGRPR